MPMIGTELVDVYHQAQTQVGGNFVVTDDGAAFTVRASIQPASGAILEQLEENARIRARYAMWVEGDPEVRAASVQGGYPGDRVEWRGRSWRVMAEMDWTIHQTGLPHRMYILARIAGDEQ